MVLEILASRVHQGAWQLVSFSSRLHAAHAQGSDTWPKVPAIETTFPQPRDLLDLICRWLTPHISSAC